MKFTQNELERMLRAMAMKPRPDWNCQGPKLPPWFRTALKRIDRRLVPQFIPPRSHRNPGGVDRSRYPNGVWAICRRISGRSRLLFKRWTWNLSDSFGRYQPPAHDTISLLRLAQKLYRNSRGHVLEDQFAKTLDALAQNEEDQSNEWLSNRIAAICRKHEMTCGHGHVMMRDSTLAA